MGRPSMVGVIRLICHQFLRVIFIKQSGQQWCWWQIFEVRIVQLRQTCMHFSLFAPYFFPFAFYFFFARVFFCTFISLIFVVRINLEIFLFVVFIPTMFLLWEQTDTIDSDICSIFKICSAPFQLSKICQRSLNDFNV